jgi:large subunit ribosomal protein L9
MKLILTKDVENLGDEGDIVTVKDGFGRNYLIPRKLARVATEGAVRQQEETKRQRARKFSKVRDDATEIKKQLEGTKVVITAKTGEENRIFGSVTSQQLAVELAKQGFDLDRRNIELDEDIRMTGVYTATVKLYKDVDAKVKIEVVPESDPTE